MAGRLGLPRDFRFMLCKAHLELPLTLHRLVTWPSLAAGNLRKKVSIPCGQVPRVNLKGLIIAEKKKKRKSVLEQLESLSHLCFPYLYRTKIINTTDFCMFLNNYGSHFFIHRPLLLL